MEQENKWMVYVSCMTYNHAPYIVDALNGFTMQETTFPYVCAVIDDASTDGEQEVIKNYLQEHFDLEDKSIVRNEETDDYVLTFARHKSNKNCYFAVLYLKYNHYSIKKSKIPYIQEWRDNSKYIAVCEGDDYWIASNKLQMQVKFLEEHPDYTMCFHAANEHYEGTLKKERLFAKIKNKEYTDTEIYRKWTIATASVLYRESINNMPISYKYRKNKKMIVGDLPLFLTCSHYGKLWGFSNVMSVYRRHDGGVTATRSSLFFQRFAEFHQEIPSIWGEHLKKYSQKYYINNMVGAWIQSKNENKSSFLYLKKAFNTSFFLTSLFLIQRFVRSIFNGKLMYFIR